jgi:phosphate transport system permease protein
MTDLAAPPREHVHLPLRHPRLPRFAPLLAAGMATAAAAILGIALGFGVTGIVVVAILLHLVGLSVWSRAVESARAATDRLVTSLVWVALLVALVPLVSLVWKVVAEGAPEINGRFLSWSMRNVIGEPPRRSRSRWACSARSTSSSTARSRGSPAGSASWST